ncbi:MAG: response regulator, partial [Cyanobacteria bacterium P01_H01_bin.119]
QQAEARLVSANASLASSNEVLETKVEARTAELRKAKDKAEIASKSKSDFLANMSHELRTPLNGILGYAQILQRGETGLSDRGQNGLDVIQQCGEHLLTLINDVLDLSKIEAQKMELYPSDFHFPALVQGVVEICRIRAEQKGIAFHYLPDSSVPMGLCGDDKRLRQILINLLGNAVKFTDQGSVTLRVTHLGVTHLGVTHLGVTHLGQMQRDKTSAPSSAAPLHRLRFEVSDTGVGMAPDFLDQLFLPFEQSSETANTIEGTGLGLAITQKIVQLMGSEVTVESELGKGSRFAFELSLPEAKEWAQSAIASNHRRIVKLVGAAQRILVIDDKWENRSVIVNLLEPLGFEVDEAEDGEAGLAAAKAHPPDLIITDLMMPKMNGFTLIDQLKQTERFSHIPVVASSASVFEHDQYRSIDAGAADFLSKPVQTAALFKVLENQLNLTWIYAPKPSALSTGQEATSTDADELGAIELPDRDRLSQLYELAKRGRIKALQEQLDQLVSEEKTLMPFVETLQPLVQQFQVKAIQSLLKNHLGTSSNTVPTTDAAVVSP